MNMGLISHEYLGCAITDEVSSVPRMFIGRDLESIYGLISQQCNGVISCMYTNDNERVNGDVYESN